MKRALRFQLMLSLIVAALTGCASGPRFQAFSPDWQNPDHGRVREKLMSLLRAADRDPMACSMYFVETKNLMASAQGRCMFAISTGLANMGDTKLLAGMLARSVAYEALGHAEKKKAASEAVVATSALPGLAGLAAGTITYLSVYQRYSPSEMEEAEKKAAEILAITGDPDPAGTLLHASTRLRVAGVVEPWPAPERYSSLHQKVMMAVVPVPRLDRPTYTLGQKWIRSDGEYRLIRIDRDLYSFSAGPGQEIQLTKDLMVAGAKKGGWATEFDSLPKLWPPAVGKWGIGEGRWQAPADPMRHPVKYTWSIDAYEEIRVPAGKFKAFRMVLSWEPKIASAPFSLKQLVTWYAPEVCQLVKAEFGEPGPLTFQLEAVDRPETSPPESPTSRVLKGK